MSSFNFSEVINRNQHAIYGYFPALGFAVELYPLVVLPEVTACEVGAIRPTDTYCKLKVVIPRTLGIALNAVVLAENF